MTDKKQLSLRPLYGSDIFKVMNLVNKLDLIEPLKDLFSGELRKEVIGKISENEGQEVTSTEIGYEVVVVIGELVIQRIPTAQNEINDFLAELTETDRETIEKLPLGEYVGLIRDFFVHEDLKELSGLFQQSMKLA